jgi:hypothetical protein
MSRIKLALLCLVAALTVSAVASVAASAAPTNRFFVNKVELGAEEPIEGTVELAQLNFEVASAKTMITCTNNALVKGAISKSGETSGEITFKGCKVFSIASGVATNLSVCAVEEPITFKFTDQLITGAGGLVEDEFKASEAAEVFVKIKITGASCTIKGTYEPKGTYVASLGDEGEVEKTEHELVYTSHGSKIKISEKPASFTNRTRIKVKSGKGFYVD